MPGRGELPPSGFGSRLRELRDEKGWTQKQLAEAAGIHVNTIARLERGEHEPAWPLVLAMTKALGVDCTAFGGKVESGPEPTEEPETKPPPKRGKKK